MRFILILCLFLLSCTPQKPEAPFCKAMFSVTTNAAVIVATVLQCEDDAAIAADLAEPFLKLNLCEARAQSLLSDLICPQLALTVADVGKTAIPADWKCSAASVTEILKSKLNESCVSFLSPTE